MCGIGLIVSGVELASKAINATDKTIGASGITVNHLVDALKRRGPDCVARRTVHVEPADHEHALGSKTSGNDKPDTLQRKDSCDNRYKHVTLEFVGATLQLRGALPIYQPLRDSHNNVLVYNGEVFGGIPVGFDENDAVVIMRSLERCCACLCHTRHSMSRECICMEEGLPTNDHTSVPEILSRIKGPWALIYWQAQSKSLWFGRDVLGRRSLLVHWPSPEDAHLVFSSVALHFRAASKKVIPLSTSKDHQFQTSELVCVEEVNSFKEIVDCGSETETTSQEFFMFNYWEELPCGIYSIHIGCGYYRSKGVFKEHGWKDLAIVKMLGYERSIVEPIMKDPEFNSCGGAETGSMCITNSGTQDVGVVEWPSEKVLERKPSGSVETKPKKQEAGYWHCAQNHHHLCDDLSYINFDKSKIRTKSTLCVLRSLKESVKRRTYNTLVHDWEKQESSVSQSKAEVSAVAPIAILFSGGLDSMILAALVDQCLAPKCSIDLLNVSFAGESAPDRISAFAGLKELCRISPSRRWRLVEVDGDASSLEELQSHVLSLICPSKTHMDLNIGTALWLAARGEGWVKDGLLRERYKSDARVILVGSGADEQCAGYGRHRTKFREGGWEALQKEMRLDVQRLWKRNMGRDDRCIADHGKEARFPFLDEDVILTLLDLPLWEIADLRQPLGQGDKKILREVASCLGIEAAASLPKRAIQFGSRIAQESNRRNFGSNRAANQACAGSAVLDFLQK